MPRVRLVGEDGEQIGIKDTKEALEYAYSKNLDLVEVAKQADPPVARVMDYGKYRYEQEQKAKQARKHQSTINIKEIKLRPKIGDPRLRDQEGPRRPLPEPAGEGQGHDHVPGAGEPPPGAGAGCSSMRLAEDVKELGQVESAADCSTAATWSWCSGRRRTQE